MERNSIFQWGLIVTTLLLIYFSFLIVEPYIFTVILCLIVTFAFYPVYKLLLKYVKSEAVVSLSLLSAIFLLLVIPTGILISKLVRQSVSAYRDFLDFDIDATPVGEYLPASISDQFQNFIDGFASGAKDYIVGSAPNLLGEIAVLFLHLFIFFFIMYFAFIHGPEWYRLVKKLLPLRSEVKRDVFRDLEKVLNAVIYGQLLTAVVQGTLGGIMLFVFGIDNPVFWGFIMIVTSFIPFLGSAAVFAPIGVYALIQGDYVAGIGVLTVGILVIAQIDNLIRPYLVSKFAPIHPILVVLGVIGGLQAFGFAGFIVGPIILALLITIFKDFMQHKNLLNS